MAARKKSARKQSSGRKARSGRSAAPRDALALLKADHQLVQQLFDKFEKTRAEDRKSALAEQICNELAVHAQIEEEIFYPAAREAIRDTDLISEATVEHQSAKDLIEQIQSGGSGDDLFEAKVTVLGEYVRHHVREEEREMFPQIRKARLDLKALGQQLMQRKEELMSGAGGQGARGSGMAGSRAGSTRSRRESQSTRDMAAE